MRACHEARALSEERAIKSNPSRIRLKTVLVIDRVDGRELQYVIAEWEPG